eukprot:4287499-Prymnesium_polylepis.1
MSPAWTSTAACPTEIARTSRLPPGGAGAPPPPTVIAAPVGAESSPVKSMTTWPPRRPHVGRAPRKGQGEIPGALAPIPYVILGRARKQDPKSGHPHS